MREFIDGAALMNMFLCAAASLEANKQALNELNVFPVPDGDTGTNMSLTMNSAVGELKKKMPKTVSAVADCTASSLLRGARGNSGVILSLLFRGISKGLKGKETASARDFAYALGDGVELAYKAVMKPAEGTILTVSRLAASAATDYVEGGSDVEVMLSLALETAKFALADTINQNPVLKRAGVVDAGGQGYTVILCAMLQSLRGEITPEQYESAAAETKEQSVFSEFSTEEIKFGYCTEFIVGRQSAKSPDLLRAWLGNIGDSLVVVDDDEIIKVHVHTNDPGKALTEALTYGPLLTVKVENMRQQHTSLSGETPPAPDKENADQPEDDSAIAEPEKKYGSVAVCAGDGLASLFRELGVDRIVSGGQTMNPSTEDILREINRTPAEIVFVFPNNKNIIMAAQQCQPLTQKKVVVIPTKTVPQGISAMLNMDGDSGEEDLTDAFTSAAENVHTALITYAARDSDFDGHEIHAGEYLGLLDGALLGSFTEIDSLIAELNAAFCELEPDFVSVYYGSDVDPASAKHVSDIISEANPDSEISLIDGGQPVYYYMISAE